MSWTHGISDYEVVWTGATHRQFQTLEAPPERPQIQPHRKHSSNHGRLPVLRALGDSWCSLKAVQDISGLSPSRTWHWLQALIEDELVEVMLASNVKWRGGKTQKLYRRRQTQEAA